MRALFDVNALRALVDKEHTFHPTVRTWWTANTEDGWATCAITQNGFAAVKNGGRLVTFDRGLPFKAVRGAEARHLVVL
jgi:predicted nucleic acid-binding protein